MTNEELEIIYDALTIYYENESESDALDKAEIMYSISKLRLKVLKLIK